MKMALVVQPKDKKGDSILFQTRFVDFLGGDVPAALLLSQIFYWYRPDKNGQSKLRCFKKGFWWIAKSTKEWKEETRMSPDQIRRSLRVLTERGIIFSARIKFNGAPTTHCRLAAINGKNVPLYSPDCILEVQSTTISYGDNESTIWDLSNSHLVPSPNEIGTGPKSLTETTSEITTGQLASASPAKSQEDISLDTEGESMEMTWHKCMASEYGALQHFLTVKEKSQLKRVRMVAEEVQLGGPLLVRWCIENWSHVSTEIGFVIGANQVPTRPHIGWLCENVSHAVEYFLRLEKEDQEQHVQYIEQKPVAHVVKNQDLPVCFPTKEQIAKDLAFFMK